MMKKTTLALLFLLALASPAQALKLIVWDLDLKNKVADGESIGGKFTVRFDKDYTGPVIALFSQTEDEKAKGTYAGLQNRYSGALRGGQLFLELEDGPAPAGTRTQVQAPQPNVTLRELLQPFKLAVSVQPTGQLPPINTLGTRAAQK